MKLEKIENATAKTGVPYLKLTIDGKEWVFFGELGDVKIGDNVLCEFKTEGKYTNLKKITKSNGVSASNSGVLESRHDIVISRVEKPHSYEFGKPNNRHKVYYGDVEELKSHVKLLELAGFLEDPIEIEKL